MPNLAERKAGLRSCEKCKAYLIASSRQHSVCSNVKCRSKLQPPLEGLDASRLRRYLLIMSLPEARRVVEKHTEPRDKCCRWGLYKIGEVLYQRLQRLEMVNEKLGDVIAIDGNTHGGFRLFTRKED